MPGSTPPPRGGMVRGGKAGYTLTRKLVSARQHEFSLNSTFSKHGYRNREDLTNLPPGILVSPSQNVLTNVDGTVSNRKGYTLDGASSTTLAGILSSYDWFTSKGYERNLRAGFLTSAGNDGKLQYRFVDSSGNVTWTDLLTGLTSTVFNFTTFWDFTTEKITLMLGVNGTSNIFEWSGAIGTMASVTNSANAITAVINSPSLTSASFTASSSSGNVSAEMDYISTTIANGSFIVNSQPANNETMTINLNGTSIIITFVNVIGATAGNVLIGANAAATAANLLGLLNAPGSTTATQVALSGANQTLVGYMTYAAVTATATIQGATSIAQLGFYLAGTKTITINSINYTYTSVNNLTFVGLGTDPTAGGITVGMEMHQTPRTTANSAMTSIPTTFANQIIATLFNQIYIGSLTDSTVYISKVNNYQNFAFTSPTRVVGEGALASLEGTLTAFAPQEDRMYISAGKDKWYQTKFTLSADLTKESFEVLALKTTSKQGAQSQGLVSKIKNDVAFVSNEPIFNTLGLVNNINNTPQVTDISYPIVNDMNDMDFTNGQVIYHRKFVYITAPNDSKMLVYNMTDDKNHYWEAPQVVPFARLSIIGGELYGHNYGVPETYKMFVGFNDNGNPANCIAAFSYENSGSRAVKKNQNKYYTEGYISSNTILSETLKYDFGGFTSILTNLIKGNNNAIIFQTSADGSLGKNPLGEEPLGSITDSLSGLPKFRIINTFPRIDYYEYQAQYSTNDVDAQWKLLAFGSNGGLATTMQTDITE